MCISILRQIWSKGGSLFIVTAVPGTTEPERWIEERGTPFWMQFYTVGTKMFSRSCTQNGVHW
jgi:hypothetical protein